MKKKFILASLLFCMMGASAAAQENEEERTTVAKEKEESIPTITHTVQMGETVILICKKYVVAPDDIYKLNPDAVNGITPGMVLRVPAEKKVEAQPAKKKPANSSLTSHHAQKKDE